MGKRYSRNRIVGEESFMRTSRRKSMARRQESRRELVVNSNASAGKKRLLCSFPPWKAWVTSGLRNRSRRCNWFSPRRRREQRPNEEEEETRVSYTVYSGRAWAGVLSSPRGNYRKMHLVLKAYGFLSGPLMGRDMLSPVFFFSFYRFSTSKVNTKFDRFSIF